MSTTEDKAFHSNSFNLYNSSVVGVDIVIADNDGIDDDDDDVDDRPFKPFNKCFTKRMSQTLIFLSCKCLLRASETLRSSKIDFSAHTFSFILDSPPFFRCYQIYFKLKKLDN